jgi:hypothetical protein
MAVRCREEGVLLYGLLADFVVIVHLGFIAFGAVSGFLEWRWPQSLWLHVPAVTYDLITVTVGFDCPLTPLEKHLRHAAGQAGYAQRFVDHYLTGVLYPDRLLVLAERWRRALSSPGTPSCSSSIADCGPAQSDGGTALGDVRRDDDDRRAPREVGVRSAFAAARLAR